MKSSIQYIEKELAGLHPDTEIEGFKRLIFDFVCGWGFTQQVLKKNEMVSLPDFEKIKSLEGISVIGHMTDAASGVFMASNNGPLIKIEALGWNHMRGEE